MDICELLTQIFGIFGIFGIFDDAFAKVNFLKQTNKQQRTINICYTVDDDQPMHHSASDEPKARALANSVVHLWMHSLAVHL